MDKKPKMPDEILPEIIFEILANLPVDSLLRFRSVCKSWKSLISNLDFQQDHHRRRCQQGPVLLMATIITDDGGIYPEDFELSTRYNYDVKDYIKDFVNPFPVPSSYTCHAIQQCRGLVCVTFTKDIYICNPATTESMGLSFVTDENHCVGFGYAAATKEFKVVTITRSRSEKSLCHILTLGSSRWREAKCSPPDAFSELSLYAPFVNGAIHFLSDPVHHTAEVAIYAFDIESEEYRTIRLPEIYYSSVEKGTTILASLNELKGFLCLTLVCEGALELWFLKDYDSVQWVKDYIIDISSFDNAWGHPLAIVGDGIILLKIFENETRGNLYYYNPKDKQFTDSENEDHTGATMYVESLLPPDPEPSL